MIYTRSPPKRPNSQGEKLTEAMRNKKQKTNNNQSSGGMRSDSNYNNNYVSATSHSKNWNTQSGTNLFRTSLTSLTSTSTITKHQSEIILYGHGYFYSLSFFFALIQLCLLFNFVDSIRIVNPANFCYFNSVIQALFGLPSFVFDFKHSQKQYFSHNQYASSLEILFQFFY